MQAFRKMKRVTVPFDHKTKEIGYHADDDALVFGLPDGVAENDSDFDQKQELMYDSRQVIEDVTIPVLYNFELDLFQNSLSTAVTDALELFSFLNSNKAILRQSVMKYLRDFGYNAAICKTKWGSSGGVTSGNYEFIDVIRSDSSNQMINRYIIDLDFAAEFEIARPTNHYKRMLQLLRNVFVGKSEELMEILKVMSEAVRQSMRSKELHIPPWRKQGFMQNKWLGAYKRSVNSSVLLPPMKQNDVVQCCSVGFNAAVNCY
ncbi:hypothetical protein EJD97_023155 [Solanum chilense]|uniref:DUF506 domain-containing protein n=1 Tax=Solanum chilense TaxID=4083 RepID=A0A6N2ASK7_SOLCI|nr:hypothetical protein EJD97_023155 [Solanum chilense]